ncbi:hypothetical protein [Cellulomonas iranensis]|uniref:hypothetical protein n=1 Tax=Cellulomonas iranensis TaxID=76862 RepID=UPI0013D406C0|nr:hypothetical protein [Cellulomonas iranensis]
MNEPLTLRGLVAKSLAERDASGRELARLAESRGFKITFTTLNAIAAGTYKSRPSDETVRAIAWLAGVSNEVAFRAAGLRVPGPPFADELPPGVDNLSPEARKAVIGILRVLVQQEEVIGDARDAAPTTPAAGSTPAGGAPRPSLRAVVDLDDDVEHLITLNPAASDAEEGADPDEEVEAQQTEP